MKTLKLIAPLISAAFLLGAYQVCLAYDCNSPPRGFGSTWARQYKAWCEGCCGTYSPRGPSCNPGSNWGCGQQGGGSGSSYDFEAERQRQIEEENQRAEEERVRQQRLEEQKRQEEAENKRRQEAFEKDKRDALRSIKGITENELGLKGMDSGELGLKGIGDTQTGLGLKEIGDSSVVDLRDKKQPYEMDINLVKGLNISNIRVQKGVPDPEQLRRVLIADCSETVLRRTGQPNKQAHEIFNSFKMKEPPSPVKNIAELAPGDVVLVAPVPWKDRKKAGFWDVGVSNGINLMDRWASNNWTSPASHAAIYLGERNGKRWYLDNTGKGPIIKEEKEFLKEYGARKMDVATLVGQPLSKHEGEEMWKGAHELRNTTTYWPSKLPVAKRVLGNNEPGMVCSEASRWLLLRAGRYVPETQSDNAKLLGSDTGLNKKGVVDFSPSDFYEQQQYFVVHQLSLQKRSKKK